MVLADSSGLNRRVLIAYVTFSLIALTLPVAFLYEKGARVLFYWIACFSIAGIIIESLQNSRLVFPDKKAVSLFLLGALFYIWSFYAAYHSPSPDEFYFTSAKRCLLAFMIVSYVTHIVENRVISASFVKRLCCLSLTLAFLSASGYALLQSYLSDDRVVMGINRATMSAYIYSMLALTIMTFLVKRKTDTTAIVTFFIIATLSSYVIMRTQTRSAMVIHSSLIIFIFLTNFLAMKRKGIIFLFIATMLAKALFSHQVIENRIDRTFTEYTDFTQGNDQTSLGSRFTLWKMGILAFEKSPLGQTQYERNTFITQYLNQHGNENSWALIYIKVHLHNEFIQYASLFGIMGVIMLLWFFAVFIFSEIKRQKILTPVAMMGIVTFLYGMTDVLMTSAEYIVVFSVLTILAGTLQKNSRVNID